MCVNISPRLVTLRRTGKTIVVDVPCGHCVECLKKRQNDWKLRICHECEKWQHCYFFTLTYREDTLPCNIIDDEVAFEVLFNGTKKQCMDFMKKYNLFCGFSIVSTACKSHVQDFVKRIREDMSRKLGMRWPLKYFICAEYGPNPRGTKRPHYHGILLCNDDINTIKPYFSTWEKDFGRIDFQEVGIGREDRSSVANYISKYCCKGGFESRKEDIDNGLIERAWSIMSKNIGSQWLEEHKQDYLRYVPTCLSIEGDWSVDDIEAFFASGTDLTLIVTQEIDDLIRNLRVFDGDLHGYKMPRYYFDRIINKPVIYERLIPTENLNLILYHGEFIQPHFCLTSVPEALTFEVLVSKDKRYVPESFLSRALSYRLRMLAIERSRRLAQKLIDDDGCTVAQADLLVARNQALALEYREKRATSSLQSFYITNMWNHREFDE